MYEQLLRHMCTWINMEANRHMHPETHTDTHRTHTGFYTCIFQMQTESLNAKYFFNFFEILLLLGERRRPASLVPLSV